MRPAVSIVMPFHGTRAEAERALAALRVIATGAGDEIVVVDNTGTGQVPEGDGHRVVRAADEHSSYYARNEGAAAAVNDWLLFVDGDCRPRPDIVDRYFEKPIDGDVGALIGEVEGDPGQDELVARYARSRGHLAQYAHWTYPYRPWGVTANLLVRRAAWTSVGGFLENVRSAGDTEFSFRLQDATWRMDYRPQAIVEHNHRDSLRRLVRQAARYGAGRAFIGRRYPGSYQRQPLVLPLARCLAGVVVWTVRGQRERATFKALDAVFVAAGWSAGFLSNTPPVGRERPEAAAVGVLVSDFPALDAPDVVEAVRALGDVHVEAARRPVRVDRGAARELRVRWAEDDGVLARARAAAWLVRRSPRRALADVVCRRDLGMFHVAPRARRLASAAVHRIDAVGGPQAERDAVAVARLLGLPDGRA